MAWFPIRQPAALVDENGKIISSTDSEYLETIYQPKEEEQNIEYDLSYHNWKLVNMIHIFGKPEELRKQVFFCVELPLLLCSFSV